MTGRMTFVASTKLTAAQVNGFLMDQVQQIYADAAARDVAVPSPHAGLRAFTVDDKREWLYDGDDWVIVSEPIQTGWDPDVTQGGSAIGNTLNWSWYQRTRGAYVAVFRCTFTDTGTGGNQILVASPFTHVAAYGVFQFWDNSLGLLRSGTVEPNSTDDYSFVIDLGADDFGMAPSDGITSGDILAMSVQGAY